MSLAPPEPSRPPQSPEPRSVTGDVENKSSENGIEEVGGVERTRKDPEVAGRAALTSEPSKELTGFKRWWVKWGFEVKLIIALLLPVFVEVRLIALLSISIASSLK